MSFNNPGRSGASIAISIIEEKLMFSSATTTRGGLAFAVMIDVGLRSFSFGSDGVNPL